MEYVHKTDSVRHAEANKLFVLHCKPHTNASKGTLARWTWDVVTSAGIDTKKYGPHSIRSVSASAAKAWGVSLEAVMKAAGWSQESTFRKHYTKPIDRSGRYSQIIQERCQSNSETPEYTNTASHKWTCHTDIIPCIACTAKLDSILLRPLGALQGSTNLRICLS